MATGAAPAAAWGGCWAWALLLADGEDPGLVDVRGIEHLPADDGLLCPDPARYEVVLDEVVWSVQSPTVLCAHHTATLRALPHGGVLRVSDRRPPGGAGHG